MALDGTLSVPRIDYRQPPKEVGRYKFLEVVTRDSLVSMLIQSFAVSRGQSDVQARYFAALIDRGALHLEDLEQFGSLLSDDFSEAEKELFYQAYCKAKNKNQDHGAIEHALTGSEDFDAVLRSALGMFKEILSNYEIQAEEAIPGSYIGLTKRQVLNVIKGVPLD